MYDQFQGGVLYMMFYSAAAMLSLVACCYLLLRQGNAFARDVTSPVRLRRWTAAFFACMTLSHLWYLPIVFLTSSEIITMLYLVCVIFDILTVFPLAIAVLFIMLQDRRRSLWPIGLMVAPLAVGMTAYTITRSDAILSVFYAYYLLLSIGVIIYMVRETRRYGRWLRDNYADLEHKEVWQSLVVLATILLVFSFYAFEANGLFYRYATQVNDIILTCFLVWRVETLSDLSISQQQDLPTEADDKLAIQTDSTLSIRNNIEPLLKQHCIDTQLYLQHDLTLLQLAKAVGTNRFYLSQYFSRLGTNYNAYINDLRINHFISLYREAVAAHRPVIAQQLAQKSGFRSYTTFSSAFKNKMGQPVRSWIKTGNEAKNDG